MPDPLFTRPLTQPPAKRTSARALLFTALGAFVLGGALVAGLAWTGKLRLDLGQTPPPARSVATASPPVTAASPPAALAAASPAAVTTEAVLDQRLAALEQRMTRLDLQAGAAAGNASRAEGLLVAFAARRAIERGAPLGPLEDQLKLRFGSAQPAAIDAIVAEARQPVTLDQLVGQLEGLAARIDTAAAQQSGWNRFRQQMSDLFVIHRRSDGAGSPEQRLDRAKLLLRTGQIEAAIGEVSAMPGGSAATSWIAAARRYDRAMRGLDLVETAALQEPRQLNDASGKPVEQASPIGQPTPA